MSSIKIPTARLLPSGSWRCEVYVNGERYSFVDKDEDEVVRKAMLCKLMKDSNPESVRKSQDLLTIGDAIDHYISDRSNILSPSTIKGYKSMRKYRFQSVMNLPLSYAVNWQSVVNDEAGAVSAKTVKNAWSLLATVLKDRGVAVPSIRLPQIIKNEHEFLQPDQIKTFVKAIECHRFEVPYLLGLHSLRRSEICAVKKSDIKDSRIYVNGARVYDDDGNLVERKENKTVASKRYVPIMIPRLNDLVADCDTDYLCPYAPSILTHPLNTVCRQNNLPEIGLHGLRHSFASLCYHLHISEMQCMEFGGWSDIHVMRKIYTHLADADRKNAEDKLRDFFSGVK